MNAQFESERETSSPRRERIEPVKAVDAPSRLTYLRRLSKRQWAIGAVVLLLVIVAIVWATGSPSSSVPAPGAGAGNQTLPLVSVAKPHATMVRSKVTFSGAIGARYDIPIGVEGEGGRITAVLVEVGDTVRRGQVLARLDQSVLVPQLDRLTAALEEARAQAALSQNEYERAKGVEAAGALSKEEIERRRATAETDAARVRVAAAQLAEAQAHLSRSEVRAPADGIVLWREAEVGQTASPGSPPLFRLAREGEIEMRGQVSEQDLPRLKVGQPVDVHLTGVSEPFAGRIRLLGAIIDPQTRLGEVRVALERHPQLRPGAFAHGEASVGEARNPILPKSAVLIEGTQAYVMIVDAEGVVRRRQVKIGQASREGLAIVDGLTGDERVVTTAAGFLREGEKVEAVEAKAAT